ncbi:MAG: hypothetical protein WCY82_02605 [Desulfotomaculaceae bacterium]
MDNFFAGFLVIDFAIKFRPKLGDPVVTYELKVGMDDKGIPVVKREVLKYRRGQKGHPWHFLDFSEGAEVAIIGSRFIILWGNVDEWLKEASSRR